MTEGSKCLGVLPVVIDVCGVPCRQREVHKEAERCIRRQKGARWGGGGFWRVKTGEVDTQTGQKDQERDDVGTSSCIVCLWLAINDQRRKCWPNQCLHPPTHLKLNPHRANISDLCSNEDTEILLIQKTFLKARTPLERKNTWKHLPHTTSLCVICFCFIMALRKKKISLHLHCNEKFSLMRQLCWRDPVLHLIIVAYYFKKTKLRRRLLCAGASRLNSNNWNYWRKKKKTFTGYVPWRSH